MTSPETLADALDALLSEHEARLKAERAALDEHHRLILEATEARTERAERELVTAQTLLADIAETLDGGETPVNQLPQAIARMIDVDVKRAMKELEKWEAVRAILSPLVAMEREATASPWHLSADGETITQTSHITRDVWTIPRTIADMKIVVESRNILPQLIEALGLDKE
jgi:chromosome condensin MukBEF ATPase and DNA-binding subunit MukB